MSEVISSEYLKNKSAGQCCHFNLDQDSHFIYLTRFFVKVGDNSSLLSNKLDIFINLTEQFRGLSKKKKKSWHIHKWDNVFQKYLLGAEGQAPGRCKTMQMCML